MPTLVTTAQNMTDAAAPLACVPGAIPAADRPPHFTLVAQLFGTPPHTEVPGGYAFAFAPETLNDVARFVRNERRCCPFVAFDIALAPADGPLTLRLTGPEGTRTFLDAEMGLR